MPNKKKRINKNPTFQSGAKQEKSVYYYKLIIISIIFLMLSIQGVYSSSLTDIFSGTSSESSNIEINFQGNQEKITDILKQEIKIIGTKDSKKIPVIIQFNTKPTNSHINSLETLGAKIKYKYGIIDAVALSISSDLIEQISQLSFIKSVEYDAETRIVLAQSALQIKANRVWLEHGIEGKNIRIAVLDTGIDNNHQDLQNVILEKDFTGEGTDDEHGHGTHVASIIAGSGKSSAGLYKGIASKASLMDIKVLNKQGSGRLSDTIAGIEYAVINNADVISMSLGAIIPCNGLDATSLASDVAVKKGIVVVVAAGNSGPLPGTIGSPGCAREVITVGAVDHLDKIAVFSSRGPTLDGRVKPDIVAPGVLITAAKSGGGYTIMSGTSMSTPMVSGVVALILSKNPGLSPEQIKNVLKETAKDLGEDKNIQGAGRVDAYLSFTKASGLEPQSEEEKQKKTEEANKKEAEETAKESGEIDESKKVDEDTRNNQKYYVVRGDKQDENKIKIIEVWVNADTKNIDFIEEINWLQAFVGDFIRMLKNLLDKII